MEVPLARPDTDVEVTETSKRGVEGRDVAVEHVPVEHDRRIGAALVGGDPLPDRLSADLLLGVEREADVDRELARLGELASGFDEHEQVRLVVGHAAGVQPAVALG